MRVVVTGATGNVGTSVIRALSGDAAIDSIAGIARRLPSSQLDDVEWIEADVANDPLADHFRGADVVVHLAWAIQPSRDESATRRTNVVGSRRVFDAVAAAGVPALVYASSVGAYSARDQTGSPIDETWPTRGIESSFYSRHKAAVEDLLSSFESHNPGVRVVRLRPALIFKGEAASEIRRLFGGPLVPGALLEPGRLPVVPWISGMRTQAVHSDDVAEAYRLAVVGDASGAFNIAAEPVLEASTLGDALGVRVLPVPLRAVRALASLSWDLRLQPTSPGWVDMGMESPLMSTGRAQAELGWSPERSSGDAIRELLAGIAGSRDAPTPPLERKAGGPLRIREFLSGVGARDGGA